MRAFVKTSSEKVLVITLDGVELTIALPPAYLGSQGSNASNKYSCL